MSSRPSQPRHFAAHPTNDRQLRRPSRRHIHSSFCPSPQPLTSSRCFGKPIRHNRHCLCRTRLPRSCRHQVTQASLSPSVDRSRPRHMAGVCYATTCRPVYGLPNGRPVTWKPGSCRCNPPEAAQPLSRSGRKRVRQLASCGRCAVRCPWPKRAQLRRRSPGCGLGDHRHQLVTAVIGGLVVLLAVGIAWRITGASRAVAPAASPHAGPIEAAAIAPGDRNMIVATAAGPAVGDGVTLLRGRARWSVEIVARNIAHQPVRALAVGSDKGRQFYQPPQRRIILRSQQETDWSSAHTKLGSRRSATLSRIRKIPTCSTPAPTNSVASSKAGTAASRGMMTSAVRSSLACRLCPRLSTTTAVRFSSAPTMGASCTGCAANPPGHRRRSSPASVGWSPLLPNRSQERQSTQRPPTAWYLSRETVIDVRRRPQNRLETHWTSARDLQHPLSGCSA